jgi:hypothetical protein
MYLCTIFLAVPAGAAVLAAAFAAVLQPGYGPGVGLIMTSGLVGARMSLRAGDTAAFSSSSLGRVMTASFSGAIAVVFACILVGVVDPDALDYYGPSQ